VTVATLILFAVPAGIYTVALNASIVERGLAGVEPEVVGGISSITCEGGDASDQPSPTSNRDVGAVRQVTGAPEEAADPGAPALTCTEPVAVTLCDDGAGGTVPCPDPRPDCDTVKNGPRTIGCGQIKWQGRGPEAWWNEARKLERKLARAQRYLERARSLFGVASRLDRALARWDSPMSGQGTELVRHGLTYQVNPAAIAAIAGVESTFGRAACGFNAWGLGACGRAWTTISLCGKSRSIASLESWSSGIEMTARLLSCLWPAPRTAYDLHGYCAGCPTWAGKVASLMRAFGSGPQVSPWKP
jgi:hypothetical protein